MMWIWLRVTLSYKIFNSEKYECSRISAQLSSVYGEEMTSVQHVWNWVHDFSNKHEEVHDLCEFGNWTQSFMGAVSKLISRYDKCIDINGNYVE